MILKCVQICPGGIDSGAFLTQEYTTRLFHKIQKYFFSQKLPQNRSKKRLLGFETGTFHYRPNQKDPKVQVKKSRVMSKNRKL